MLPPRAEALRYVSRRSDTGMAVGQGERTMMTCDEAKVLLHALLDSELDAGHAREVEAHVAGCPRCAAELSQFREMRKAVAGANLRFAAPAALRSRVEAAIP